MKKLGLILVVLAMLLVGCGAGREYVVIPVEVVATAEPTATDVPPTRTPAPTPTPREPKISDFGIELVVVEEKCFGSAGCLVTVRIDLGIYTSGLTGEWLLVYEISGVDDGVATYSLEVDGDTGMYTHDEEMLRTSGSDALSVEIVRILQN